MNKNSLDVELLKYLEDTGWHTPYTEEDVINAYLLAKKTVIDKLRERIVLFGGDATIGIRPEELDNL
jgi:hypothetical protein